jgi:TRL-like protein family
MKKLTVYTSAIGLAALLTGCVMPAGPTGSVMGGIYSDVSGPVAVTGNPAASKTGEASSSGLFGFAWGDSSIKAAASAGGITKISHVDSHTQTVLGVYGKTTTVVYGE